MCAVFVPACVFEREMDRVCVCLFAFDTRSHTGDVCVMSIDRMTVTRSQSRDEHPHDVSLCSLVCV